MPQSSQEPQTKDVMSPSPMKTRAASRLTPSSKADKPKLFTDSNGFMAACIVALLRKDFSRTIGNYYNIVVSLKESRVGLIVRIWCLKARGSGCSQKLYI